MSVNSQQSSSGRDFPEPLPEEVSAFQTCMEERGGAMDLTELDPQVRSALKEVRGRCLIFLRKLAEGTGGQPGRPATCGILNRPSFNAVARLQGSMVCIGLNVGLIRRVFASSYAMLATKEMLPGIGNTPSEVLSLADAGVCCLDDTAQFAQSNPSRSELRATAAFAPYVPRCPRRRLIGHVLGGLALEYLLYHEFFHGWGGHLHLCAEHHVATERCEGPESPKSSLPPLDSQALEYDADKTAAWILAAVLRQRQWMFKTAEPSFETVEELVEAFALALCWMVLTLDPWTKSLESYDQCSHPHPEVRFWCLYEFFEQSLGSTLRSDVDMWKARFKSAVGQFSQLWSAANRPGTPFAATLSDGAIGVLARSKLLSDRAQSLYKELRPHDLRQLLTQSPPSASGS